MSEEAAQRGLNYDWKMEAEYYEREYRKTLELLGKVERSWETESSNLEAEIAELKQKQASDQMWIQEISTSVKAGLWEPFLQSSLSAGIVHGRAISTSLEREARTQKLVTALARVLVTQEAYFKYSVEGEPGGPFTKKGEHLTYTESQLDVARRNALEVARKALAEYRDGEGGEEK